MNRSVKTAGSIKDCLPKILTFICKFSKRALNVFPTGRYISSAMVFSLSETWPKEFFRGNFPGEKNVVLLKFGTLFFPRVSQHLNVDLHCFLCCFHDTEQTISGPVAYDLSLLATVLLIKELSSENFLFYI